MKALVGAFNQEKALIGAFSMIMNLRMELFEALTCLLFTIFSTRLVPMLVAAPTLEVAMPAMRTGAAAPAVRVVRIPAVK